MCGIFGEFLPNFKLTPKDEFIKLNNLATKRGPDSDGYWSDERMCTLGFRRLAIIDLSDTANQPMHSHKNDWVIIFNGEIYNHLELREQLPKSKYNFKSHSDTETILCCIEEYGFERAIEKLDGMFGIAAFHIPSDKLYLARDFAGIKPVFYGFKNNNLVFASQYDQVALHPLIKGASYNNEVLKTYLNWHYVPAPLGLHEGTHQLRPGEIIVFDKGGMVSKKIYWEFPNHIESSVTNEREALDIINDSLKQAVADEMLSDVPLGAFLSGGIDSPLIVNYARKKSSSTLKTFSIGSDSKKHDESEDARYYAEKFKTEFLLDMMDSDKAAFYLENVMQGIKEPLADFSVIPTWLVCNHARKQVTVSLSGDGGDELFYGYERFWSLLKNRKFSFIPKGMRYIAYAADKVISKNKYINSNFLFNKMGEAHAHLHSRFHTTDINNIFPELENTNTSPLFDAYNYIDSGSEKDMLLKMAKAEFYGMMQKTLAKVDRMSMENSLEVRVPFLKKSFIEKALTIDPYLSCKDQKKKEILKTLLRSKTGHTPNDKFKRGFSVPLDKWLREQLKQPVYDTLLSDSFITTFDIDKEKLQNILNVHKSKKADMKWPIFTLYALAISHAKIN